ncbi:MAG: hypothetical protein HFH48_06660 [Lachnospiraceae bacterium]|nr:hypothetical protein [Lachnospiraceae bacterium]
MSKICVEFQNDILKIQCVRARMTPQDTEEIDVRMLVFNRKYRTKIKAKGQDQKNTVFYMEPQQIALNDFEDEDSSIPPIENENDEAVLAVWSDENRIWYSYRLKSRFYKELVNFSYKVLHLGLSRKYLSLYLLGYFRNAYEIPIQEQRFYIDEKNYQESKIKIGTGIIPKWKLLLQGQVHHFKVPLESLLTDDTQINNTLNMILNVDGVELDYRIGKRFRKKNANIRHYYAPYKSCYMKDFAIHLRRTDRGNFSIVKRLKEAVENRLWFKLMESRGVSWLFYHLGRWRSKHGRNVNLFYEKFAEKAEEGTFDLFLMAQNSTASRNYYIIDEHSEDYQRIKKEKNVVRKYSLKYYWLLYRVNYYISTEAPAHLNILRSNNKYFRKSTCEHPFIFLQHGVTYLKCQGPSSTFVVGKEGEPEYIIVGSEKEKDVVCDMLHLPEERIWNTGLPIFSKIDYKHINQDSEDKAVIMLTWKTYEEHLLDFEQSEYYKNVIRIYQILEKYMDASKIIIVPHPKVVDLLAGTNMKDSVWKEPISEVLKVAKLLVTDYSSVCYNVFYQGGGVVFYQPDLELYEMESGKLIPSQEEYIGARVFDLDALEQVLKNIVVKGEILLDRARSQENEVCYQSINEFCDGKNIERIHQKLVETGIL